VGGKSAKHLGRNLLPAQCEICVIVLLQYISLTTIVLEFTPLVMCYDWCNRAICTVGVPLINNEVRTETSHIYPCLRKRLGVENAEKVLDNFEKECRQILGKFHLLIHYIFNFQKSWTYFVLRSSQRTSLYIGE